MSTPRLNLLVPTALTGLCYRALGGAADPAEAELTRRGIEQLQEERTTIMQEVSSRRADADILAAQAAKARHDAKQAQLDLALFERQAGPPPPRGLLKRRLSPDQQATENQRVQLRGLAERAAQDEQSIAKQELSQRSTLEQLEETLKRLQAERLAQTLTMQEQLAARVLNLTAAGHGAEALTLLDETRRLVRGDLMVAVLHVVVALLGAGIDAALPVLGEFKPLFIHQHEPLERILTALLAVSRGRRLTRQELGLFPADSFDSSAFFRLYQLVRALAGWDYDEPALSADPFGPSLWILREYMREAAAEDDDQEQSAEAIAQWCGASADLVVRTIGAMLLLSRGGEGLILQAAGIDLSAIAAPKRKDGRWPGLWELLGPPPPAWPRALDEPWRTVLGCLVLLAARDEAPPELFAGWLEESYNWPKSDFYWWTLARIKADQSLLTNLNWAAGQLVDVAPV